MEDTGFDEFLTIQCWIEKNSFLKNYMEDLKAASQFEVALKNFEVDATAPPSSAEGPNLFDIYFILLRQKEITTKKKWLKQLHKHNPRALVFIVEGTDIKADKSENLREFFHEQPNTYFISPEVSFLYYLPLVEDLIIQAQLFQRELKSLAQKTNSLNQSLEKDYAKIQKVSELLNPLKKHSFSGVDIYTKFVPGEASGGEILDMVEIDKTIFIFCSQSASHSINHWFILRLMRFKNFLSSKPLKIKKTTRKATTESINDTLLHFTTQTLMQLKKQARAIQKTPLPHDNTSAPLNFSFLAIDRTTLNAFFIHTGTNMLLSPEALLHSNLEHKIKSPFGPLSYGEFRLERGTQYALLSRGAMLNLKGKKDQAGLTDFLQEMLKIKGKPQDILTELFFHLKTNKDSPFLKYDATSILIEVSSHVLYQT